MVRKRKNFDEELAAAKSLMAGMFAQAEQGLMEKVITASQDLVTHSTCSDQCRKPYFELLEQRIRNLNYLRKGRKDFE